jgi:hypothetical protein
LRFRAIALPSLTADSRFWVVQGEEKKRVRERGGEREREKERERKRERERLQVADPIWNLLDAVTEQAASSICVDYHEQTHFEPRPPPPFPPFLRWHRCAWVVLGPVSQGACMVHNVHFLSMVTHTISDITLAYSPKDWPMPRRKKALPGHAAKGYLPTIPIQRYGTYLSGLTGHPFPPNAQGAAA